MAQNRRTAATEVDFSDFGQAETWFQDRSREVCIALPMRSALRVLPLIDVARSTTDFPSRIALPVLRACFVTRLIAEAPSRRDRSRSDAAAAADAAYAAAAAAGPTTAAYAAAAAAGYAGGAAVRVAAADAHAARATYTAVRAAAATDRSAANRVMLNAVEFNAVEFNPAHRTAAAAARADAVAIEQGRAIADIIAGPLWPVAIPKPIAAAWDRLRTWMLEDEANSWEPWVQWYERVRDGRPSFGAAFDLAVASLTDEQWNEEPVPAAVNRRIAALLAEHTGGVKPPVVGVMAAREGEPQTGPEPVASEARPSPKPNQRGNRRPAKPAARTTIGKALLERSEQVQLALVAVISLIDEKLQQLRANRPNHPETIDEWTNEIIELEKLRGIVEGLQADVADYLAGLKPEKETIQSVKSFADGVEDYWSKNHTKIIQAGLNTALTGVSAGLFVTAVSACSAMGAGGTLATVICGAIVGGKPVIELLKSVAGRGSEAARRLSGRRSHTNRPRA